MLNTTVKDVHIRLWAIFIYPFANVKWFLKQWVNGDPRQFTLAWNICVFTARKVTLDWKITTCLKLKLKFNVPDFLKARAFAPTSHLCLGRVVSHRSYLLSLMKIISNHIILQCFCCCLSCTFCEGVLLPPAPGAGGLLFARSWG